MNRGDICTVAGGQNYVGKPRPAVVIQDDAFAGTDSLTVCILTTVITEASLFRVLVEPSEINGLRSLSQLMVDKISTVPKTKLGPMIGRLEADDIHQLNQAILLFLGLARS